MPMRRLPLLSLVAALAAPLAGAPGADAAPKHRPRLVAFDSCRALVGYAHRYATRAGGAGVPVRALGAEPQVLRRPLPGTATPTGEPAPTAAPMSEGPGLVGRGSRPVLGHQRPGGGHRRARHRQDR